MTFISFYSHHSRCTIFTKWPWISFFSSWHQAFPQVHLFSSISAISVNINLLNLSFSQGFKIMLYIFHEEKFSQFQGRIRKQSYAAVIVFPENDNSPFKGAIASKNKSTIFNEHALTVHEIMCRWISYALCSVICFRSLETSNWTSKGLIAFVLLRFAYYVYNIQ